MPPQIVVHTLADAVAALEAAQAAGCAVVLASAPGAAGYAGPLWFCELAAQARTAVPQAHFTAVLDCADAPGHALAAIRAGVTAIAFTFDGPPAAALRDIARQAGVAILALDYASAFDMQRAGVHDAPTLEECLTWLRAHAVVDTTPG